MLSNIDAVIWDFDGVINRNYDEQGFFWLRSVETDFGISLRDLQAELFGDKWGDVLCGRISLLDRLSGVLPSLGCAVAPKTFLEYWMARDFAVDEHVIDLMRRVRQAGKIQAVATNNESIRTQLIWEDHALQHVADHIFASGHIGAKKPDLAFFDAVERKLGLQPSRLLLIDDAAPNVAAAHAAGWKAHLYGDFATMRLGSPVELDELLFGAGR